MNKILLIVLLVVMMAGCSVKKQDTSGSAWVLVLRGSDGGYIAKADLRLETKDGWREGKSSEYGIEYFIGLKPGRKYTVTAKYPKYSNGNVTFIANETRQDVVVKLWVRPETDIEKLTKRVKELESCLKCE